MTNQSSNTHHNSAPTGLFRRSLQDKEGKSEQQDLLHDATGSTSKDRLVLLSHHPDPNVRAELARHESCPIDILTYLAKLNPKLPEDMLRQLGIDPSDTVRRNVALNPSCPQDLLRKLASDDETEVRINVISNPVCQVNLLRQQANDVEWVVRSAVAKTLTCPEDLLRQLANDTNVNVRISTALNPATPIDAVLYCLPCFDAPIAFKEDNILKAFDVHRVKLIALARSGKLDFDMQCAGGETLKEGLINAGQVEIYNLLMAEHLAGKTERLADNTATTQHVPSRMI
jgi:hypothetical protein